MSAPQTGQRRAPHLARRGGLTDAWRRAIKALALLSTPRFRRALRHGVAAAIEHRHLASLAARTVVDVGANRGQFALLAGELFPGARVIAFEPLAAARRRFRTVLRDEGRIELHSVALGRVEVKLPLNVTARDDCSSLLPVTPAQRLLTPRANVIRQEWVTVAPLTRFLHAEEIETPALLKIDVQGYEAEVLAGARPLLPCFDAVYIEASFRELYAGQALSDRIIDLLHTAGFELQQICNPLSDARGELVQADFDFRRGPCRR